ncbi:MAG: hypothetical protein QXO86_05690 [Nitrososphaerota archaeon]
MFEEDYKRRFVFGCDFGTSDYKYGPISLGERPRVMESRGYFPEKSVVAELLGGSREVVVGSDVALFLGGGQDLSGRLVYPMRDGIVGINDEKGWRVIRELIYRSLSDFKPSGFGFKGFYVVASLSAVAPLYMYERLYGYLGQMAEEGLAHSSTIIPQPLAVAIAHKQTSCVVVESGHGNTQVAPISQAPIRSAVVALNRGGGEANAITAEILKDTGYGDLAKEEKAVRLIKERLGLLPLDLNKAISYAKSNREAVRGVYQIPGTRIKVDLGDYSWTRFLIGEIVFDPNHEIFQSYFRRGMPRPEDTRIGDTLFYGMMDLAETVISSVEKCPVELQPHLYGQIILSGGNFNWSVPASLRGISCDSKLKLQSMLHAKGVEATSVVLSPEPQYAVWRGCIVYGYALPHQYEWSWEKMEGWLHHRS